jgi:hypothetical protein
MPSPLGLKPCIGLAGIVQKSQNGQAHQVDLGEWPTCCPHQRSPYRMDLCNGTKASRNIKHVRRQRVTLPLLI